MRQIISALARLTLILILLIGITETSDLSFVLGLATIIWFGAEWIYFLVILFNKPKK